MSANLLRTLILLAIPLAGLFGTLQWVDGTYAERTTTSIQLHEQAKSDLEQQHAKERAANAVKAHEIRLENERRHQREVVAAAGGPADYAIKNPELTLSQMLSQLALACAPKDSKTSVKVDHFTEFEIVVDFPQPPEPSTLGEITSCVLSRSAAYLHAIRFTHRGTLIAELTPEALNSVPNWATISSSVASSLLTRPSQPTQIATANTSSPGSASQPEASPKNPALEAYNELLTKQLDEFNQFIQTLFSAGSLPSYNSAAMIQEKLVELDNAWASLKLKRDLLANPLPHLDRLLRQHGSDPLYNEIVLRGERERLTGRQRAWETRFHAIQALLSSTSGFLMAMHQTWGQWSVSGDQIQFDSRELEQTYRTWSDRVKTSADELNAALAL